jgi:hypothetical protein
LQLILGKFGSLEQLIGANSAAPAPVPMAAPCLNSEVSSALFSRMISLESAVLQLASTIKELSGHIALQSRPAITRNNSDSDGTLNDVPATTAPAPAPITVSVPVPAPAPVPVPGTNGGRPATTPGITATRSGEVAADMSSTAEPITDGQRMMMACIREREERERARERNNAVNPSTTAPPRAPRARVYEPGYVPDWDILYFSNVYWCTLRDLKMGLSRLWIDMSNIIHLAWRRDRILEVVIERNSTNDFTSLVTNELKWQRTSFRPIRVNSSAVSPESALFRVNPMRRQVLDLFKSLLRYSTHDPMLVAFLKERGFELVRSYPCCNGLDLELLWSEASATARSNNAITTATATATTDANAPSHPFVDPPVSN